MIMFNRNAKSLARVKRVAAAATLFTCAGLAQAGTIPVLDAACERALALSALPERLRGDARVYRYHGDGFQSEGEGTFHCIVARNHPLAIIPQCTDAAGADTIIPALIHESEQIAGGATAAEARASVEAGFAAGRFRAAPRPGISYMASNYNHIYVAAADRLVKVPPHVMFYAPGLSNEDIGGSQQAAQANHGLPFVIADGPHGYMVSFIDQASDSGAVQQACGTSIGEQPRSITDAGSATDATMTVAQGHQH